MACFVAPLAQAAVVAATKASIDRKGGGSQTARLLSQRLGWLNQMLLGGSFLLAIEHIWHGEIVAYPPFLTALQSPATIGPMLQEIATVGVAMAVLITAVWLVMVGVSARFGRAAETVA